MPLRCLGCGREIIDDSLTKCPECGKLDPAVPVSPDTEPATIAPPDPHAGVPAFILEDLTIVIHAAMESSDASRCDAAIRLADYFGVVIA